MRMLYTQQTTKVNLEVKNESKSNEKNLIVKLNV